MTIRMTSVRINRVYNQEMEKLGELFLCGKISIEQYNREVYQLDRWASFQYDYQSFSIVMELNNGYETEEE